MYYVRPINAADSISESVYRTEGNAYRAIKRAFANPDTRRVMLRLEYVEAGCFTVWDIPREGPIYETSRSVSNIRNLINWAGGKHADI